LIGAFSESMAAKLGVLCASRIIIRYGEEGVFA
jgi:hypothetical protein